MKNTNVLGSVPDSSYSPRITRVLTLSIIGVVSLFMLTLAVTASAATLNRQLQIGSRGDDVSALQAFLAKDVTLYPQGLVTGYFGNLTSSAVSNFQARNGIATVGPVTLAALNLQMDGNNNSSPAINSINVNVSNVITTLSWNTDKNSSAIVYYGTSFPSMVEGSPTTGVTIGGQSLLVHTDLRTSHTATLTGLNTNTVYYYVIYVRDGAGNESVTWPSTFHTNQ